MQFVMRLAYLVMVHKNFEQVKRLFNSIYERENFYLFHVDAKSEESFFAAVKEFIGEFPNARMMPRQNCRWGGYSMVDIELKGIRQLLDWSDEWRFFINISGQDFPLKTQTEIKSFLTANQDRNFLTVFDDEFVENWCNPYPLFRPRATNKNFLNARSRVERVFFEMPGVSRLLYVPFIKREFISDAKWYAGWQWMLLNRDFCEYLFGGAAQLEKYTKFFKNTFIPDEGFFQTVIMNSPHRDSVINDSKRTVVMQDKGGVKIFRAAEYDYLVSSDNFFARKFDSNVDDQIIEKLERRLFD